MRNIRLHNKLLIFLLFPIELFGQIEDVTPWDFKTLKDNNFKEIISYEFNLDKKGRKRRDSSLIYHYWIDNKNDKIYGNFRSETFITHGKLKNPYSWHYIESEYDSLGQLIKETSTPQSKKARKKYGDTEIDSSCNILSYEYNSDSKVTKEIIQNIFKSYSIFKYSIDTFKYESGETQIYTTNYNEKGQPYVGYLCRSRDSLRYKDVEWIYNDSGLLSIWISYTRDGEYHTKRYYLYNDQNKIIQQIDSTGWYLGKQPMVQKIINYEYFNDGTYIETQQMNLFLPKPRKWTITFNSNNLPIKGIDSDSSGYTLYEYIDKKLRKETTYSFENAKELERIWEYNNYRFLIAEYFINYGMPKYSKVTKYYYK